MNRQRNTRTGTASVALAALVALPVLGLAQTPVDDDGNPLSTYEASPAQIEQVVGNEDIPLLGGTDLEELVGPIALYPDELLAIVLPASAYPLQVVEAARFLEALEDDPSLEPDPEWDDSIVALLNYPEILEHLNEDIDWTWRLGEAVVAQQGDVVAAIERFRDRAYAAGNLKSDAYQNVTNTDGVIEISPVADDVIYVPYYEPERVVVYQPRPVYYYYPRAYPVYYYPYSSAWHFDRGYFWGVTTAFTIGWMTDSLHVYHHSYHGHPYYGWAYRDYWWYRRPPINVYNTTYVQNTNVTINRYYEGDRWHPRNDRVRYLRDDRHVRSREYQPLRAMNETRTRNVQREQPITFRERPVDQQPSSYRKQERRMPVLADRSATQQSRREPVARQPQRRESVTRPQQTRREPVARPQERRQTVDRPQLERREAATRPQPQRQTARTPSRSQERPRATRPERRPERAAAPQRSQSRSTEQKARPERRKERDKRR